MNYNPDLPTPLEELPAELQLQIFEYVVQDESPTVLERNVKVVCRGGRAMTAEQERDNKMYGSNRGFTVIGDYTLAFTSAGTRSSYRTALRNYAIRHSDTVTVRVQDFDFAPFKAFLAQVKKTGGLAAFRGPAMRALYLRHITTNALPQDAAGLVKMLKTMNSIVFCHNRVIECRDLFALMHFRNIVRELDTRSGFLNSVYAAIDLGINRKRYADWDDGAQDMANALKRSQLDAQMYDPDNLPPGYGEFVEGFGPLWRPMAPRLAGNNEEDDGLDDAEEDHQGHGRMDYGQSETKENEEIHDGGAEDDAQAVAGAMKAEDGNFVKNEAHKGMIDDGTNEDAVSEHNTGAHGVQGTSLATSVYTCPAQ